MKRNNAMENEKEWWLIAAMEILAALADRQGIGDELDAIDDDMRAEIEREIANIIVVAYDAA